MAPKCDFKDPPDNLIKLNNLTKALEFADVVRVKNPETKEFKIDVGTSFIIGLFKNVTVAVSRVYSSAGTEFPQHEHPEWELVLVYQGKMHLKVGDKTIILKEKEFYYLNPGTIHGAYYPVDSWVLCVTMPASKDFPEGS